MAFSFLNVLNLFLCYFPLPSGPLMYGCALLRSPIHLLKNIRVMSGCWQLGRKPLQTFILLYENNYAGRGLHSHGVFVFCCCHNSRMQLGCSIMHINCLRFLYIRSPIWVSLNQTNKSAGTLLAGRPRRESALVFPSCRQNPVPCTHRAGMLLFFLGHSGGSVPASRGPQLSLACERCLGQPQM